MRTILKSCWRRQSERGQDLAEYAVLIGLLALAVVGSVLILGGQINAVWETITTFLSAAV